MEQVLLHGVNWAPNSRNNETDTSTSLRWSRCSYMVSTGRHSSDNEDAMVGSVAGDDLLEDSVDDHNRDAIEGSVAVNDLVEDSTEVW
jgi:hypothetical protein